MTTEQRDPVPPIVEYRPDEGRMAHPGATLQAAREAKGLTTAQAATSLRLPEKILVHLEAGRFDQLPGDTFARGYVRSYARLLGLDANRLVLEYDRSRGIEVRERQVSGIDKMAKPSKTGGMLVTWTTVIVALAIVASILLWWYDSQPDRSIEDVSGIASQVLDEVEVDAMALPEDFTPENETSPQGADTSSAGVAQNMTSEGYASAMSGGEADLAVEPPTARLDAPVEPNETAQTPAAEPSAPELEAGSEQVSPAAGETIQTTEVTAAPEEAEVAETSGLQMQFSGDCWVQVTTPGGASLHSALMQAGQSLNVDHDGPIEIVIGAVEAVSTIAFNGEPVDTKSVRESGVVRLRLG